MITAILGMPEDAMLFFFFSSNVRHKFREFLLYIYIYRNEDQSDRTPERRQKMGLAIQSSITGSQDEGMGN